MVGQQGMGPGLVMTLWEGPRWEVVVYLAQRLLGALWWPPEPEFQRKEEGWPLQRRKETASGLKVEGETDL